MNERTKASAEETANRYSTIAQEALAGTRFEQLPDEDKQRLIEDTSSLVGYVMSRAGGRLRSSSPDVLWSGLEQAYRGKLKRDSAYGRFRLDLQGAGRLTFGRLYSMLEAGVSTIAELEAKIQPPEDLLVGLREGNATPGVYKGSDFVPHLKPQEEKKK